ncbi:GNAT family N-acetyltransferase [Chitinophaga sp. 22321]|uniref:GNAT family N-acetyltransferase n=1 Tax=Chitinophaga hostae TaxID=2831022 RepID=A0ABS5J771_9BACT|nr:GNAT family N-acetyltransferase [Chitinophaga hostae]MBS0031061.1 GNAT family N-acetyltransferase [Chitinophaga hostae]
MSDQQHQADPQLVAQWVQGWSLAREVALPVWENGVYRVEVGWPDVIRRFVFPSLTPAVGQLAETISDPYIILKIFAAPEEVRKCLPSNWMVHPAAFMMTCLQPMKTVNMQLDKEYTLDISDNMAVPIARVLTSQGEVAAIGRIAFTEDAGIYDRIETHPLHRRRGLGTVVMKALESVGAARGITKGLLVATAPGRALYETLGWEVHSLYTTAEIPAQQ